MSISVLIQDLLVDRDIIFLQATTKVHTIPLIQMGLPHQMGVEDLKVQHPPVTALLQVHQRMCQISKGIDL
jgi:hypothetical protein